MPDSLPEPDGPVVLFDGVCNLCSAAVQWVIERDPDDTFRFASLQSAAGQALLEGSRLPANVDSIVLVEDGEYYTESTAALRIARRLRQPYPVLSVFRLVPRAIRDRLYRVVADNRYDWFGRTDACMVPTPALRERFLDDGVGPTEGEAPAPAGSDAAATDGGTGEGNATG